MPQDKSNKRIGLRYFEDVLGVEFGEIARRRAARQRQPIARNSPLVPPAARTIPDTPAAKTVTDAPDGKDRLIDVAHVLSHAKIVAKALEQRDLAHQGQEPGRSAPLPPAHSEEELESRKQRPAPVAFDATGLALSGGGVRSAALSLGALQALSAAQRLASFDYISTVSGGGYIGATLTAGLAKSDVPLSQQYPFGTGVADAPVVAHLRDYSNYLFPRDRSTLRNWTDVIAILLRGLVCNAVPVGAAILALALLTFFAFPTFPALLDGSFVLHLLDQILGLVYWPFGVIKTPYRGLPFAFTLALFGGLALVLIAWALARSSRRARSQDDAESVTLKISGFLVGAVAVSAVLDLQPIAIHALATVLQYANDETSLPPALMTLHSLLAWAFAPFAAVKNLSGAITFAGAATILSAAGHFLQAALAQISAAKGKTAGVARFIIRTVFVMLAAMIVPLALWGAYLYLTVTLIEGWPKLIGVPNWAALLLLPVLIGVAYMLGGNAYSLLGFYRDRLRAAFVFWVSRASWPLPAPNERLKLSGLTGSLGPYPIINSALNIQGSRAANRRGRNADFFVFTPNFVGSDLTLYAPTADERDRPGMESVEPTLDLSTAIAISGAAISSDMGSSSLPALAPTLALLNIRLGYWALNPRWAALDPKKIGFFRNVREHTVSHLYLLAESLGLLDETSPLIYLTDGGHIENLGIYELLKRGAKLIVVIDGEADPDMTFRSLQTLERYARIDFGIRINLPWDRLADAALKAATAIDAGALNATKGPHCVVGRILYGDGALGVLVYFKASLSGDESDYALGYRKNYPSFPHETTADQFFSEEQFEAYRTLGFHMVSRFFADEAHDNFCWLDEGEGCFATRRDAFDAIDEALPKAYA